MCVFVNSENKRETEALQIIAKDHKKMLLAASHDFTVIEGVRTLVTGYHRKKLEEAETQILDLGGIPTEVANLIHTDSLTIGNVPNAH
jgi:hypothetical protein